jgi:HPr kinase/phosphorylase
MPIVHGACIALGGAGVLIRGPSGSGKSSLALSLAAGPDGTFVADDCVVCEPRGNRLVARAHHALAGRVEVRGQGILDVTDLGVAHGPEAVIALVIDLVDACERLPDPPADAEIAGLGVPRLILDRGVRAAGLAPLLVRAALRKVRP